MSNDFNELQFDPKDLKKNLEQNLGANFVITTTGETKKDRQDKDEFMNFFANLELVLVNQHIASQDLGIDLEMFLTPMHDANLYLMVKHFGELSTELILTFIENRDEISEEYPMQVVENDIRYSIVDVEDLYTMIKMFQTTVNKNSNGTRKR